MKSYVFISNSSKPNTEKANSKEVVQLSNVNRPCLTAALDFGYNVFFGINRNSPEGIACELPVNLFDSHTYRSVTAFKDNWIAIKNLSSVIKNNEVEVIHCNTPVGGLVGRVCGKRYGVKTIIYTAHGFHFFRGAPLINRLLYKTAEQIMARWTDVIITMNEEDYLAARKFYLKKGGKVYKVHGVGITLDDYHNIEVDRRKKREELSLGEEDFVCICAGDLVSRKNYSAAIRAIARLSDKHIHFLICGNGPERDKLVKLIRENKIDNQIHLLGFRTDIKELLKISDIFLFTSLQEGLPRSLMEAMAVGLPVIASSIRGNVDLISDGIGGLLYEPNDIEGIACGIKRLSLDKNLREKMSAENIETIKQYDISVVEKEIKKIYSEWL